MTGTSRQGFTLVELLVIVTLVVLLLALLMPAMSKAVYQAQLVGCGALIRTTTHSVTQYAFDHKRHYPDRAVANRNALGGAYMGPMSVVNPLHGWDIRPSVTGYMSINKQWQCPFNEPVEIENARLDVIVESSYMLLWGWQYQLPGHKSQGMFRIGDRFTVDGDPWGDDGQSFNVLMSDMDLYYPNLAQSSHPDRDPLRLYPVIWRDYPAFGASFSLSRYNLPNRNRGVLDTNYGYDDGSVIRFVGVVGWGDEPNRKDERMARVPLQFNGERLNNLYDRFYIPTR